MYSFKWIKDMWKDEVVKENWASRKGTFTLISNSVVTWSLKFILTPEKE